MKKLLLAIVLLLSVQGFGQKTVEYVFVHEINLTKNDLYKNAKNWLSNTYKNYKDVVDRDDKEDGVISGKGYYSYYESLGTGFIYNFKIECKESKWRFTVNNLFYKNVYGNSIACTEQYLNEQKALWDVISEDFKTLVKSDKEKLSKKERRAYEEKYDRLLKEMALNPYPIVLRIEDLNKSLYNEMIKNDDF